VLFAPGAAGKESPVFSSRESKKRAILKLLDRIPLKKASEQVFQPKRAQASIPAPRPAGTSAPEKLI
jgi:hypothetical protein